VSALHPVLLGLGLLLPADPSPTSPTSPTSPSPTPALAQPGSTDDPGRLQQMLLDRKHPRDQSQAALLLLQERSAEAEEIVRQGLRQTDEPEVFQALASAIRLERDTRFAAELLDALLGGRPVVRHAAAGALAETADPAVMLRLQTLIEDARTELAIRQEALWVIGKSGRKSTAIFLLEQLASPEENLRRTAADALTEQTGLNYGLDIARWRSWWEKHKDRSDQQWLEDRLAYQSSRARRVEDDLERAKSELVQLHQDLYQRLPPADRLGHVQALADSDDPTVRALAVTWSSELLSQADSVGQRTLANVLLRLSYDGNPAVQRSAVLALGRVNDPRAVEQLTRLVRQGKPSARAAAGHALTQQARWRPSGPSGLSEPGPRNAELIARVVPLLQKALDDPDLEVVVAAAEDLGALGVPEAGPVLVVLLRHPFESVRQTAAQALERVAGPTVLDGLLAALDDPSVTVRFGLVGALGRVAAESRDLPDPQRSRMLTRLEELLLRDPDSGVRSRAATVIGQTGAQVELPFLWRRLQSREDSRVQEKTWGAMLDILARSANFELVRQWDRALADAPQPARRLEMLAEVATRWKKDDLNRGLVAGATELLVQAQLDQGKWAAAIPLIRELLDCPGDTADLDRRLGWLLRAGERALLDGNCDEALRAVAEAQPFLPRSNGLGPEFEKLDKRARSKP
jgi:HEAT repeat protein